MITAPEISVLPSSPWPKYQSGIYVHIPFCITRCDYCDFNAYAGLENLIPAYVDALVREVESLADGRRITTIFFGGGTPTRIPPGGLATIMRCIRESFDVDADAETTVEANPESVDAKTLDDLLQCGFNRLSIGVQSTDAGVLASLGRVHTPGRALETVRNAASAGFRSVNADLIYGTPGETRASWRRSMAEVVDSGPDHLSAYALTVEEGTPLHARVAKGAASPDEDELADKYEESVETLTAAGFERYEVSNFAKHSKWCLHNLLYWTAGEYLGFGAGAHAHMGGRRSWNVRAVGSYIASSPAAIEGGETLAPDQARAEAAVLGLRLSGGLRRAAFAERWGADPLQLWPDAFARARQRGLLEIDDERVRPSGNGFLLLNQVARDLVITPE